MIERERDQIRNESDGIKRLPMKKPKKNETVFQVYCQPDETEEQSLARTMISPTLQAAVTISEYASSPEELDLQAIMTCLEKQVDQVKNGNIDSIEQMLLVQACTTDVIANNLFRKAYYADVLVKFDSYMKYGLRAQSQCRATLETLANIKNPKAYLKQTNIAHNQQVNNDISAGKQKTPNELLEKTDGERLDFGKAQEAVRVDSDVETVGAKHRPKNKRRKG